MLGKGLDKVWTHVLGLVIGLDIGRGECRRGKN